MLKVVAVACLVLVVSARHVQYDDGVVRMSQYPSEDSKKSDSFDENVVHVDQSPVKEEPSSCGRMVENYRFDCYPEGVANQSECEARGCCWTPEADQVKSKDGAGRDIKAPWCYFPTDYPSYVISEYQRTKLGYKLLLTRKKPSYRPNDIMQLQMDVILEEMHRLHFKIYDPKNARYEVPIDTPPPPEKAAAGLGIEFFSDPFGFVVGGGGSNPIMDTSLIGAPLIFTDQFIQISARIPSGNIYGLGEHKEKLLINASAGWQQREFWARDHAPAFGTNLYGVHPFYMGVLPAQGYQSSISYGVLLLNSNAMEIDLQPMPALTYRTIGGVLDFYVFYGFSPDEVVQYYTEVIGRPYLPPYWSLGFHLCKYGYMNSTRVKQIIDRNRAINLPYVIQYYTDVIGRPYLPPYWSLGFHMCRWGYKNSSNLREIINRNRAIGLPYEAQWTDIDYMDAHKDWTYDHKAFSGLPDIVTDLHKHDQKYVIIVDPGIPVLDGYAPYEDGMKMDIFIKNSTGQPLIGKVWPGTTVYPDFTNPQAQEWWYKEAKVLHDQLPFDGLWTDMNEPSNFVDGSIYGCTNNNLDKPPYTPGINGGSLQSSTICPSAKQHLSTHYNLHSMYGHFEVKASKYVLEKLNNKRSLVISRSTFPGTGHYGGHWSGDISSTWEDLAYSIPEMLRFQMFGIPLVGADICGFGGDTTEELCTRWMQLGAFYPFMRNHNSLGNKDQDPAAFSQNAQVAMIQALNTRYAFLPYLYSLFVNSHLKGSTVARPYFFVYPSDPETYGIDEQFFWGDALLISPVLTQGATTVKAYFNPNDTFYDVLEGTAIHNGSWQTLDAPLWKITVHARGGSIFPVQRQNVTTTQARLQPFGLLVALGVKRVEHFIPKPPHRVYVNYTYAGGELYWDDGESLDSIDNMKYNYIRFNATEHNITSEVVVNNYKDPMNMKLTQIYILGLTDIPKTVMVNSKPAKVNHEDPKQIVFEDFEVSLTEKLFVSWT